MKPSDVSVVIQTYKRPRLLARALESVLQQDLKGLHIRVLDNASGDETGKVVELASRRQPIEYICHPQNIGGAANLQVAVNTADRPYTILLNDDDIQLPGLLTTAIDALSFHPEASAFCGRVMVYLGAKHLSLGVQGRSWAPGVYRAGQATAHMVREHFTPTAVMFKTKALQGANFTLSDTEMMARFSEHNDFVVSDKILGAFLVHDAGWTSSQPYEVVRRVILHRITGYLQLTALSDDDRTEVLVRGMADLMSNEARHVLVQELHGERSADNRSRLARATKLLAALETDALTPLGRSLHAVTAGLASLRRSPMSKPVLKMVDTTWRLGRKGNRRKTRGEITAAERDALDRIAELERHADALVAQLARPV